MRRFLLQLAGLPVEEGQLPLQLPVEEGQCPLQLPMEEVE